jgi:hypothetical protein
MTENKTITIPDGRETLTIGLPNVEIKVTPRGHSPSAPHRCCGNCQHWVYSDSSHIYCGIMPSLKGTIGGNIVCEQWERDTRPRFDAYGNEVTE